MMTPTTPGAAAATILFAFTSAADCPPSRAPPSLGKPSDPLPHRRLGLETHRVLFTEGDDPRPSDSLLIQRPIVRYRFEI